MARPLLLFLPIAVFALFDRSHSPLFYQQGELFMARQKQSKSSILKKVFGMWLFARLLITHMNSSVVSINATFYQQQHRYGTPQHFAASNIFRFCCRRMRAASCIVSEVLTDIKGHNSWLPFWWKQFPCRLKLTHNFHCTKAYFCRVWNMKGLAGAQQHTHSIFIPSLPSNCYILHLLWFITCIQALFFHFN